MWNRLKRRVRRLLGQGWGADEFAVRYAAGRADAWGYEGDPSHALRADRIVTAFAALQPRRMLELGCAEGFLTEKLAGFAGKVVACDLSLEAVERARKRCRNVANVQFECVDIRSQLPRGPFDGCLASDVLYYLSPREIQGLAKRLSELLPVQSTLVIANEWNMAYRDLTKPAKAHSLFVKSGHWYSLSADDLDLGAGKSHFLAVLRRS